MSAGYFEVDTNFLSRDTAELEQIVEELRNRLSEMQNGVQQINSTWEGSAKNAFIEQVSKDAEFYNNYIDEIVVFLNNMKSSAHEYDKCESEVLELVQSINI